MEVEQEGAAASPRPPTRLESALTVQARPHLPLEAAAGVAGVAGVAVAAAAATAPTSAAVRVATATAMSGALLLRQRPTSHSRHHPRTRPHHRPHHRSHRPIHPPPPQQRVPHGRRWRAAPKGRRSGTRVARRGCRQPRGSRRISFAASDGRAAPMERPPPRPRPHRRPRPRPHTSPHPLPPLPIEAGPRDAAGRHQCHHPQLRHLPSARRLAARAGRRRLLPRSPHPTRAQPGRRAAPGLTRSAGAASCAGGSGRSAAGSGRSVAGARASRRWPAVAASEPAEARPERVARPRPQPGALAGPPASWALRPWAASLARSTRRPVPTRSAGLPWPLWLVGGLGRCCHLVTPKTGRGSLRTSEGGQGGSAAARRRTGHSAAGTSATQRATALLTSQDATGKWGVKKERLVNFAQPPQ